MKAQKFNSKKEALVAAAKITGFDFYEGYENANREDKEIKEWYVDRKGNIFFIIEADCKIFHKLTIHAGLSGRGFNNVGIFRSEDHYEILINKQNWGNTPENRKSFAEGGYIVTTLLSV